MSSAINHKKRSRRGHRMQRTYLAPKHSPLVSQSIKYGRRRYSYLFAKFIRRLFGMQEG